MINDTPMSNVETIELLVKQAVSQSAISKKDLHNQVDVRVLIEHVTNHILVQLRYYIAYQKIAEVSTAADWWSGLKLALFGE